MKRTLTLTVLILAVVLGGLVHSLRAGDITPQAITDYDLYNYLANTVTMGNSVKAELNKARLQLMNHTLDTAAIASNGVDVQVADFAYVANGVFGSYASAAVAFTAAAQATSTFNIYLLSVNQAGTASATKGTAASTLAGVTWPTLPTAHAPFGYIILKSGNVSNFTLGTSAFGIASTAQFFNISVVASESANDVGEVTTTDLSLTGL